MSSVGNNVQPSGSNRYLEQKRRNSYHARWSLISKQSNFCRHERVKYCLQ